MSDNEGASNTELLMAACKSDSLELLDEALSSDSAASIINYTDGIGNSCLHYAARNASTDCLEVLLHFPGINVNVKNRLESETPLHKAAVNEYSDDALKMCKLLVENGADVKVLNKNKQTPADVARSPEVRDYLEAAALATHFDASDFAQEHDSDSDGVPSDDE